MWFHLQVVQRLVFDDGESLKERGDERGGVRRDVVARRLAELEQLLGAQPAHLGGRLHRGGNVVTRGERWLRGESGLRGGRGGSAFG